MERHLAVLLDLHDLLRPTFLTYETEFAVFLAVLENSVLPMGRENTHATFKVTSEVTSLMRYHEKHRTTIALVGSVQGICSV